jgi:hypothetical protein
MYTEVLLTVLVSLCIVMVSFLAMAINAKIKQRRKRRMIERGITDLVSQVRN